MTCRLPGFGEKGVGTVHVVVIVVLVVAVLGFSYYDWDSDGLRNFRE